MRYFSAVRVTFSNLTNFPVFRICGHQTNSAAKLCDDFLLAPYLNCLIPNLSRNFRIYHSLFNESLEDAYGEHRRTQETKKKSRGIKAHIINENNEGSYMFLSDAEKYAKRKNLTLIKLPQSTAEKPKYKLESVADSFKNETIKDKDKKKSGKNILLRENISKNDLLIKISQMVKFLEKGTKVVCLVECKDPVKLKEIQNELNATALQQYSVQKVALVKGLRLIYVPKVTETEKDEVTEKKTGPSDAPT